MTKLGDIAICTHGHRGLITHAKGSPMSGMTYYGIHLDEHKLGNRWESKHPKVIGNIYDFLQTKKAAASERTTQD